MNRQLYYSNNSTENYYKQSVSLILKDVFNLMSSCYGPYGSHLLIDHQIRPEATKDGKAILSSITTNSSISSAVLKTIINVANKQVAEVGDGSTTTILLLCNLYSKFNKLIYDKNISPSVMNKSIKNVVDMIIDRLTNNGYIKSVVNDGQIDWNLLYNAINISADGDADLSKKILEMFKELNCEEPLVLIELSQSDNHHYETVKGVEETGTLIRPDVYLNGFSRQEYDSPYIVAIDGRMDLSTDIYFELCRYCVEKEVNILFMGTGMNPDTMNSVVAMSQSGNIFNRCPVFQLSLSSSNDNFLDMCASLGAKPISEGMLKNMYNIKSIIDLISKNAGRCDKLLLTETTARFNNPTADEDMIKQRLDIINEKLEAFKNDDVISNDSIMELNERKAFMNKHYAKFYVGGYSPQRKSINFELADDAIKQAISCMKHGVVPGCNMIIPSVIVSEFYDTETTKLTDIERYILEAIYDSYISTYATLVKNKDSSYTKENAMNDIINNAYSPKNMRGDGVEVINSAETDKVILRNASDMAALLCTAKGFISTKNEFDVVQKGYDSLDSNDTICNI